MFSEYWFKINLVDTCRFIKNNGTIFRKVLYFNKKYNHYSYLYKIQSYVHFLYWSYNYIYFADTGLTAQFDVELYNNVSITPYMHIVYPRVICCIHRLARVQSHASSQNRLCHLKKRKLELFRFLFYFFLRHIFFVSSGLLP